MSDNLAQLVRVATQWDKQDGGPFDFMLAKDIVLEPKLFLIDGFVGQKEQSAWFGPKAAGKSAVMIDLSCHIAAGRPYCGRNVTRGAVLYLACERGAVVKRRIKAWCIEHGIDDIPVAVVDAPLDLRTNKLGAGKIIATVQALAEHAGLPVVMIVVDTTNRALAGGEENSSKDIGALIASIDMIYRATGAHCALVHHTPADRTDRMRGHGSLSMALDLTVAIVREHDGTVLVTTDEANDLADNPQFRFAFKSVLLPVEPPTTAPVLLPVEQTIAKPKVSRPKGKPARSILALRDALLEAFERYGVNTQINGYTLPAITLDQLDTEFSKKYLAKGKDDVKLAEAKRSAFNRALEHMPNGYGMGVINNVQMIWRGKC
jgi:hypothetical protein